jgi:transcription-repair coupling factor (superfamily II helicase)
MRDLLEKLRSLKAYDDLIARLKLGFRSISVHSLYGSARSLLMALLREEIGVPMLVVTSSQDEAEKLFGDLSWIVEEGLHIFPEWHSHIYADTSPPKGVIADHMSALAALMRGERSIVICPINALMHRIIPKSALSRSFIELRSGMEISPVNLTARLERCGYERVAMVEVKGQFALRGGILDIYPLIAESPVRVEFFGDEIDSIRAFDPTTQRSTAQLKEITILPTREFVLDDEAIERWEARFEELYRDEKDPMLREKLVELDMRISEMEDLDGLDPYLTFIHPDAETVLDYLPQNGLILLDEPIWIEREAERLMERMETVYRKRRELGHLAVPPDEAFTSFPELKGRISRYTSISLSLTGRPDEGGIAFDTRSLGVHGNVRIFLEELRGWQERGYSVQIFCESEGQMKRMEEVVEAYNLDRSSLSLRVGTLSDGFISDELRMILFSDVEIFNRKIRKPYRRRRFKEGAPILSYADLKEGDYVVHVSHGIGVYEGLKRIEVEGAAQDFLAIRYAGGDILYVPTYQINLVQKYIGGSEDVRVRMDRLGGTSWSRVKQRVKESVQKLARELLELYASRQTLPGYAFSQDAPWQREFEALFPYEETLDQLRAIEDVKRDMEQPRPMDRLICGDVGYGKTEVAMRAAFKAVMDNKQVAVLVPTTVLAQQHFMTFSERFADFPIRVEMLSRFQTPKRKRLILEGLRRGTVDIVIGTHMLLQDDVKFKDLGLVIIDEEHRFGVKQKERLKQMRKEVDVLTMTATPIPRTLYMAISGIRDMSVIETPPENRQPIETYVMEYDPQIVRDAILREMARGGQVFYVHNRVQTIASTALRLQEMVPEARIAVGHGQMSERMLEKVMLDFIAHKYDVLVCTTIIESGIDMPNVNTIIIDRADMLGLAQLYQLRGRVGRSDEKAYGYLFYPRARAITEGAQKRLKVIEEFTDLGSGFKIALRDMEIRGVGNILGPEQHGHVNAVGYELYCKLLEEAVKELRGEEVEEEIETRINLPLKAYIPDGYVPDSFQKVSLYKRIALIRDEEDVEDLREEMEDRFGPIPKPVSALLEVADLKRMAAQLGVASISSDGEHIRIVFDEKRAKIEPERIISLVRSDNRFSLTPPGKLTVRLKGRLEKERVCRAVKEVLETLSRQTQRG